MMQLTLRRWSTIPFGRFDWPAARPVVRGLALGCLELWRYIAPSEADRRAEHRCAQSFALDVQEVVKRRLSSG